MTDQLRAADPIVERLLRSLGAEQATLVFPGGAPLRPLEHVLISDEADRPDSGPGTLVLLLGAQGQAALRQLRFFAEGAPTAIAVKGDAEELRGIAAAVLPAETALIAVHPRTRWEHVARVAREQIAAAQPSPAERPREREHDLFAVAEATAALAGGPVIINDGSARLLAFSADTDGVDEMRRASILGRQPTAEHRALLKRWGVFAAIRDSETPVHLDPDPATGVRRRVVIGINVGDQHLGHLWVQEGERPLSPQIDRVLIGAARRLADELVQRRDARSSTIRPDLVAGLLGGGDRLRSAAHQAGLDPERPAAIVLVHAPGGGEPGAAARLQRSQVLNLIAIHAAAFRRDAIVGPLGTHIALVVSGMSQERQAADLVRRLEDIVRDLEAHTGVHARAVLGAVAPNLRELGSTFPAAERGLAVLAEPGRPRVARVEELAAPIALRECLDLLGDWAPQHPGLAALLAHSGALAPTLLAHLEHFGDVSATAAALGVHRNTVQYRIRRAAELAQLDLGSAEDRLLAQLVLRLAENRGALPDLG